MALGANTINMALLPAGLIAATRRHCPKSDPKSLLPLGMTAAISLPLAAALIAGETAAFRSSTELAGWQTFAAFLLGTHAWLGVVEAGLTVAAVMILRTAAESTGLPPAWRHASSAAALAILAAAALTLSSSLPDGYEAAAQASGMNWLLCG
jgi:hypothetical protein